MIMNVRLFRQHMSEAFRLFPFFLMTTQGVIETEYDLEMS